MRFDHPTLFWAMATAAGGANRIRRFHEAAARNGLDLTDSPAANVARRYAFLADTPPDIFCTLMPTVVGFVIETQVNGDAL